MSEETPVWNMDAGRWAALGARATGDALEDGAYVRPVRDPETVATLLHFYATALNKPDGWRYQFLEDIPGSRQRGAFVGQAWHEPETGFVKFEVAIGAAAQALSADYESGVADMDYVAYEQAVERAMRGTPADLDWLHREFGRLVSLTA